MAGVSPNLSASAADAENAARSTPPNWHFGVLLRYGGMQLRNTVDQQLREAPVRAFAILALLVVVWVALYWLFALVLRQVGRWELIAVVANQHIFVHFFLVLAVMLAFSNAILAFGSLFSRREAACLLALPVPARQAVCLKWLEGMLLSSWAFLLLGVPLMLAVARNTHVEWYYYPLFVGHFMGFIIIPATFGLLVAWAVAMWAPRRPMTVALWAGALLVLVVGIWGWTLMYSANRSPDWLNTFYSQVALAKQPLLPSTWSAKGIAAAMQKRAGESLSYLLVVLANGVFLAWLTVNILGSTWAEAYSRAQRGRGRARGPGGRFTATLCRLLFFWLPYRVQMIMLKDLRGFVRDATQWTQMVIMLGLLVVYAANLKRLPVDLGFPGMRALLAFLNLTTVSLILATFTSRFVFPLLSLESQQLWLLGLLPVRRVTILLAKFVFSLVITGLSALIVVGLAVRALDLPANWVELQLVVSIGICIGLSGLSVGIGARFPVLGQRNPARIASGFGGTLNLIASMLFVGGQMTLVALASLQGFRAGFTQSVEHMTFPVWLIPVLVGSAAIVAAISLAIGARHFARFES